MKTHIIENLKIIIVALLLVVGTQYVSAVNWVAPTGSPPGNNTSAPINVGNDGQSKVGGIELGTGLTASGLALNVPFGIANFDGAANFNGAVKMKLGSSNPTGKVLKAVDAAGSLGWADDLTGGGGSQTTSVSYGQNPSGTSRTTDILTSTPSGTFTSVPAPSVLLASCPDNQVLTGLYLQQGTAGIRYEVVGVKCAPLQTP